MGGKRIRNLLKFFGTGEQVWKASTSELSHVEGINTSLAESIGSQRLNIDVDREMDQLLALNIKIIEYDNYPELLKEIYDPPLLLFARGNVNLLYGTNLGVVGTRKPSGYAKGVMEKIIPPLTKANLVLVSGMARGVDGAVHRLCLKHSGSTVAVLGTGLDRIYPPEHRELYHQLTEKGLVISEFPLGTPPYKQHFPMRNRIISGLCRGVFVIEAPIKSGAIITAEMALEQNRDVFCVPGNITNPQSEGCNRMISDGAKLVVEAADVLKELGIKGEHHVKVQNSLNAKEKALLSMIPYYEVHIDDIAAKYQGENREFYTMLLELELDGLLTRRPGGYIMRV